MRGARQRQAQGHVVPMLAHETLYVGIDVGKAHHLAGFVSTTLLQRHHSFTACPALKFPASREGFRTLLDKIGEYVPLEQCRVLLEKTGHYHHTLIQYLQDLDVPVHVMHVLERPTTRNKTDRLDALGLANHLYNQLEKGIQVANPLERVRPAIPPSSTAAALRGVLQHRRELVRESTRRKNKLTAICDEVFPEFTQVFKDPNSEAALGYRQQFPTPATMTAVSLPDLSALRHRGRYPSLAGLAQLHALAHQSIGTTNAARLQALLLEQEVLIAELHVMRQHIARLDAYIADTVSGSRDGQILASLPGFGLISTATLLAAIGHIDNFPSAGHLKAFCGWTPQQIQSGTTLDRTRQHKGGVRALKSTLFMVINVAIQHDGPWKESFERLRVKKCVYDERTRRYKGTTKVIGKLAGQMLSIIYGLLKQDAEVLRATPPGKEPPSPLLYDVAIHHQHRQGAYRSMKPRPRHATIIQLPMRDPSGGG